jgi:hypothetical protein
MNDRRQREREIEKQKERERDGGRIQIKQTTSKNENKMNFEHNQIKE